MRMKKLGIYLFLMCYCFLTHVNAQESEVLEKTKTGSYDSDWVLFKEDNLVKIYSKYTNCSDPANGVYPEQLLFRVENKTNRKVYVYWNWSISYNGKLVTKAESDEDLVQVTLESGEIAEGGCSNDEFFKLRIFVKDSKNNSSTLTDFAIVDFNSFEI